MIIDHADALGVYTLEEAAAILKCDPSWLGELAAQRKIPYTELAGSCHFTSAHLAAIIAVHERLPASMPSAPAPPALAWTLSEAAVLVRCKPSWLEENARRRKIPFTLLSGSYHFTDEHLAEIIRIFEVIPAASPAAAPDPQPTPRQRRSRTAAPPALPPGVPLLTARPLRKRGKPETD